MWFYSENLCMQVQQSIPTRNVKIGQKDCYFGLCNSLFCCLLILNNEIGHLFHVKFYCRRYVTFSLAISSQNNIWDFITYYLAAEKNTHTTPDNTNVGEDPTHSCASTSYSAGIT